MAKHTPLGVVAATFILLYEKDPSFPRALAARCSSLTPLLVYRIGAVVNHLADKGLVDARAVAGNVQGPYPNVTFVPTSGAEGAVESVVRALKAVTISANLNAAMNCVVGIQDSVLAMGVDKVIGAADSTAKATSAIYKQGKAAYEGYGKAVSARDKLTQLRDFLKAQRGSPVDIFINAM